MGSVASGCIERDDHAEEVKTVLSPGQTPRATDLPPTRTLSDTYSASEASPMQKLQIVIRGQCDVCGFCRNIYFSELGRERPCDHLADCTGHIQQVYRGPKSMMPDEFRQKGRHRTITAGTECSYTDDANAGDEKNANDDGDSFARPDRRVSTFSIPKATQVRAAWMWGDAQLLPGQLGSWLAKQNPAHWSQWKSVDQTVSDLYLQRELSKASPPKRIRVIVKGCNDWPSSRMFDTIDAAIAELNHVVGARRVSDPRDRVRARESSKESTTLQGEAYELQITLPDGSEKIVALGDDGKSLAAHVVDLCRQFELPGDDYMLTRCVAGETKVISTWRELSEVGACVRASLESSKDIVTKCLAGLQRHTVSSHDRLLKLMTTDTCLAEAMIESDVLEVLLQRLGAGEEAETDAALLCIFELLQHSSGLEWLQNRWTDIGQSTFTDLFRDLFPIGEVHSRKTPHAALAVSLYILRNVRGAEILAHTSAKSGGDSAPYGRMLQYAFGDYEDFRTQAAHLVFGSILNTDLKAEIKQSLREHTQVLSSLAASIVEQEAVLSGACRSMKHGVSNALWEGVSQTCAQIGMQASSIKELRSEKNDLQRKYVLEVEQKERFRSQVRNLQRVMEKMLPFLHVPESLVVSEGVSDIVKSGGWNTVEWKGKYSLLHYVCEFSKEPSVADLVAALCTETATGLSNFDACDIDGCRAGDYAKTNSESIAQVMEGYRQEMHCNMEGLAETPYTAIPGPPSQELSRIKAEFRTRDEQTAKAKPNAPAMIGGILTADFADELILKYWAHAKAGQYQLMIAEMQRSRTTGGFGLNEEQAKLAAARFELLTKSHVDATPDVVPGNQAPQPTPDVEPDNAAPQQGKVGGKGRGMGQPPPKAGRGQPPPKAASAPGAMAGKGQGKNKGPQPTKKDVTPAVPMKKCRWNHPGRFIFGAQDMDGSVWESISTAKISDATDAAVMEARSELERRFADTRQSIASATAIPLQKKPKLLKAVEGDARLPMELAIKNTQSMGVTLANLPELICSPNAVSMDPALLRSLNSLCKDSRAANEEDKWKVDMYCKAIEAKRLAEPDVEIGEVEKYLLALQKIPALSQRLDCMQFILDARSEITSCKRIGETLREILTRIRDSKALLKLLSLTLSVGNYLNGGDPRLGCADGFHIDAFGDGGCLSTIKDVAGGLKQFLLKIFIIYFPDESDLLVDDLSPLFQCMKRQIVKRNDEWVVTKSMSYSVEDYKKTTNSLQNMFETTEKKLREGQKIVKDRADGIHTDIQVTFDECKVELNEAKSQAADIQKIWLDLRSRFCTEQTRLLLPVSVPGEKQITSQELTFELFARIWDDFFMPGDRIVSESEKTIKDEMVPRFGKFGKPVTLEDLRVLWGLSVMKPSSTPKATTSFAAIRIQRMAAAKHARSIKADNNEHEAIVEDASDQIEPSREQSAVQAKAKHHWQKAHKVLMLRTSVARLQNTRVKHNPIFQFVDQVETPLGTSTV